MLGVEGSIDTRVVSRRLLPSFLKIKFGSVDEWFPNEWYI